MYYWRITRYNPQNRDENGFYISDEWSSISDIGKKYNDVEFTYESYISCENAYADTVTRVMRGNTIEFFTLEALQKKRYVNYPDFSESESKKYFRSLKRNMQVPKHEIIPIVRFALREIIWCKLVNDNMFVHFGYDYYMYIGSENKLEEELSAVRKNGLFVETIISPYL